MIALVTDGETRAALELVRSLGAAGHTVFVAARRRWSLAALSRWCSGEFLYGDVVDSAPLLAQRLEGFARLCSADRLIGVTDRTLTALHAEPQLAPLLPHPDADGYAAASDKTRLFEDCRRWEIPVPDGVVCIGGQLPDRATLERLGPSWAVRPALSWRWDGRRWLHGVVRLVDDEQTLQQLVQEDPALRFPFLIQRVIEGDGCGLFVHAERGELRAIFSHRRLREKPPWGGVSTLCRSVAAPRDLRRHAERYLEKTAWSGLAMLEFKRDRQGRAHLLEINARPWGSIALARASGVDFANLWLEPQKHASQLNYTEGVHLRWWWGDVDHYFLREGERSEGRVRRLGRALMRAITDGPQAQACDTFRRDDPLPFVGETVAWLKRDNG